MSTKIYEAYRIRKPYKPLDPYEVLWEIQRRARADAKEKLTKVYQDILDGKSRVAAERVRKQDELFKAWVKGKYADDPEAKVSMLSEYVEWLETECPPELKVKDKVLAVEDEEIFKVGKRDSKIDSGKKPGILDIDAWAHMKYGEQVTRHRKDLWALDVSVTVRVYRERFFLIPYCERSSIVGGCLDFMKDMKQLDDFAYWNNVDPPEEVPPPEWAWRETVWDHLTDHSRWTNFLALDVVSFMGWHEVSPMMEMIERGTG